MTDRSELRGRVKRTGRELLWGLQARTKSEVQRVRTHGGLPTTPRKWLDSALATLRRIHRDGLIYIVRGGHRRQEQSHVFFLEPIGGESRRWRVSCTRVSYREGLRDYHTRIQIGEHALERIFQRTGSYTADMVAHELMVPILSLVVRSAPRESAEDWLPCPHGLALVVTEVLGTEDWRFVVVTFVATYQLTDEQQGLWHYRRAQLPEECRNLLPAGPLDLPGIGR